MNVLVVEPGFLPYEKEIPDSLSSDEQLRALQEIVGGYIEAIYPYEEDVAIVCNEEGLINGLPFNRSVPVLHLRAGRRKLLLAAARSYGTLQKRVRSFRNTDRRGGRQAIHAQSVLSPETAGESAP